MDFAHALEKLERLSPEKLDQTSKRIRGDLGAAEWKMGLCLLAWSRSGAFRKLGFATVSEYGERALNLSGRKIGALLGAARALEHLPKLSDAFRRGEIGWGKVRVIHGLATPETEAMWLDFALAHKTEEVARNVTLSPTEWKHHRALQASLQGEPLVTEEAVSAVLAASDHERARAMTAPVRPGDQGSPAAELPKQELAALDGPSPAAQPKPPSDDEPFGPSQVKSERPVMPAPPKKIRLVVELSPDQYALYEQAEIRVRARVGRRISRAEVVTAMAENVLNQGTARARAKHQVLVHTVEGTETAWYDTERGMLPVSPEVLEEALQSGSAATLGEQLRGEAGKQVDRESPEPGKDHRGDLCEQATHRAKNCRPHIPNDTVRALYARAGHRCERCRAKRGPLHIHHTVPVSEGGDNVIQRLKLLCPACHSLCHMGVDLALRKICHAFSYLTEIPAA